MQFIFFFFRIFNNFKCQTFGVCLNYITMKIKKYLFFISVTSDAYYETGFYFRQQQRQQQQKKEKNINIFTASPKQSEKNVI